MLNTFNMWHGGSVEEPCDFPLEEVLDIKSDRDLANYPIPDEPVSATNGKAKTACLKVLTGTYTYLQLR